MKLTICVFPVILDPDMPQDRIELRSEWETVVLDLKAQTVTLHDTGYQPGLVANT